MPNNKNLIPARLTAGMVRSYIDFDGHDAAGPETASLQARLQSQGVAGLWHLLEHKGFAYLSDEVGMGKTRQAMGIIATQFLRKPDSRVVIVCSSATLQRQWQSEWSEFLRTCYKLLDDRLLSSADASQLEELHFHHNLRDFIKAMRLGDARIHLLRYSSFSRPLTLKGADPESMLADYAALVGVADPGELDEDEKAIAESFSERSDTWKEDATHALAAAYCRRIGALLTNGTTIDENCEPRPNQPLDLVIFDEAQYLRHTGNYQNQHIAQIFRRHVDRWLFMSATPLHSSTRDIRSLDTYLCRKVPVAEAGGSEGAVQIPRDCGDCEHQARCSRVTWQLDSQPGTKPDVVELLRQMMVRRTRTYADRQDNRYGKIQYRKYERVRYSGADDPFLSLTMALVQKHLVGALAGKQNRFRQGECASFESLSTSVGRIIGRRRAAVAAPEVPREYEAARDGKQGKQNDEPNAALDRTVIDDLNHSFVKAMTPQNRAQLLASQSVALPHAKLNRTADELFEHSLKDGGNDKTLVFVRRIDTVEEIRDLLNVRFQQQVDQRIAVWRALLIKPDFEQRGKSLWDSSASWWNRVDDSGEVLDEDSIDIPTQSLDGDEEDDFGVSGATVRGSQFRDAVSLPYFEALKRASGIKEHHGKLVSFGSRLLSAKDPSQKPLRGFLLKRPEDSNDKSGQAHEAIWVKNGERWLRFLAAILGVERVTQLRDDNTHAWLFANTTHSSPDAWKLAALQLCVLQSMRQTDFIVDLYILNTHVSNTPDGATELPDKLLWMLESAQTPVLDGLATYIANWKEKFRRWIEHFDLIVDKCLRSGTAVGWEQICRERVHMAFRLMSPVIGRSSRLENQNAVTQFKFPTHPNVLVCTDVLKEGVDMHLFCDNIVHYGVAWTSGDLEQRIGRIDRLGSLIGRRIEHYASAQPGTTEGLPRLGVAFPYLDGTLDRYQVDRVIRGKIASDLRMDLGKRKEEIGELDVNSLGADDSILVTAATGAKSGDAVFYPDSAKFVQDGDVAVPIALARGIRHKHVGENVRPTQLADETLLESTVYLPAFDSTRVRRVVTSGSNVLRLSRASAKDPQIRCTEEVLVPFAADLAGSPATALRDGGPWGVRHVPDSRFAFDRSRNTVGCEVDVSFAFTAAGSVAGKVLLESIGGEFWLLRAAVCATDAVREIQDGKNVPRWLAGQNRERRWGYLMEDAGIVWFAAMVREAGGAEWRLLAQLAGHAGRVALFYRSMVTNAAEHVEATYRSRCAFPSVDTLSAAYSGGGDIHVSRLLNNTKDGDISNMKHEDLMVCGQVLAGIRAWFSEAFDAVLDALYEGGGDSAERRLTVTPLEFLEGGVLRLSTDGAEHFRLQAYLDLNDAMSGGSVFAGPKMLWELAASPISKGQRPVLPLSQLHEFPHVSMDAWEGEPSDGCRAFTWKGDKYRFLAVYHAPGSWDSARTELLEAWQTVRMKMQALANFQKKACRDAFVEAVGAVKVDL
ncbi:helicase [Caballeronia sordidicola]|uniref:Helicase n=1 Tax=Caballeronia sordidicola TaxID=196367 RepID=A0A158F8V9_CABSO|nr:DEAD/DEAH box helicase [Caballeronia sordidicola]SAL16177.1 helicase [Caballeronia sordidicola]